MLVIAAFLSVVSCKKVSDTNGPEIRMTSPGENDVFSYQDNIPVNAHITDDKVLKQVTVSITNAQGQVFLDNVSYNNPPNPLHINLSILFDDLYLSGGTYYVRIIANDGENESVVFRPITLTEAPKVLKRISLFSIIGDQTVVDTLVNDQLNQWLTLPYKFKFAQFFSGTQTLCLAHSGNDISILGAAEAVETWSVNIPSIFGEDFFTCSTADETDNKYYLGCMDGRIRRVDAQGGLNEMFVLQQGFIPKQILIQGQYLIVLQENNLGTQQQIAVFNKQTGFFIQSTVVDFQIRSLLNTNYDLKILLAGNSGNASKFRYYNIETNYLNGVFTLYNPSLITGAWPVSDNRIMCAHEDGIYVYDHDVNNISGGLDIVALKILPDKTTSRCFAISSVGLHIINNSGTQEILFIPKTGIADFGLLYNK